MNSRKRYTKQKSAALAPICSKDQAKLCFLVDWLYLYYESRYKFLRVVTYALRAVILISFLLLWVFVPHHENVVALYTLVSVGLTASYFAQRSYSGMEEAKAYWNRLAVLDSYSISTHQNYLLGYYQSRAKYRTLTKVSMDNTMWCLSEPCIPYNGVSKFRYLFRHLVP
jgi:hypothetical protein